ncbi:hypothetical protein LPAF129_13810 [Ligilactobacillus pabuli]|uniref:Uncharacterized protein n=1 Tax=Ligilactobacillus pabuli TaxID=2886039 RepID=A0ABQ5JI55_9LACO|nr:hypothetical protein LPAF129_13810 [Ligilactobacillus pabuli]
MTITFLGLLVAVGSFLLWQANGVTKINYNQTYTYENKRISPDPPSYFRIVDGSHYVTIPQLNLEDDYNQGFKIDFIQGSYTRSQGVLILGKNITRTRLWFDNYQAFEKGMYSKKNAKIPLNQATSPFEEGQMFKKHGLYYYKSKRLDTYLSIKKKYVSIRLKPAKINIPTTEKEFIQRYHKKQSHQQE